MRLQQPGLTFENSHPAIAAGSQTTSCSSARLRGVPGDLMVLLREETPGFGKLAAHKKDIFFLLVANFNWFIIGIGCWFHHQTLVCCWKAPAVTSWCIISPTTIDHRRIMIRHGTSTINPSYPPVIKHGT